MIGVTADTNVYVSALIFAGAPRHFLEAAESGLFSLAISDAILAELRGVLQEKFNWSEDALGEALLLLSGCTMLMHPTQTFDVVPNDPDETASLNAPSPQARNLSSPEIATC